MALIGALSSGRTGLVNSGNELAVIGNNIANAETVGFKGSRTEFADLISAQSGGTTADIGLGSTIADVRTLFDQGTVQNTGRSLDLALNGQGFFVLREGTGQAFTRAGNFELQANGAVTNTVGNVLQGSPLTQNGTVAGPVQDIVIGGITSQAKGTTTAAFTGNLQSDAATTTFPSGTPTEAQAYAGSSFSTSVQVYDSLGKAHNLLMFFSRTGTNAWQVNVGVDAADTGGTAGTVDVIGTDTLNYNTNGTVASGGTFNANVTFTGAGAQTVALDLSNLTQFAGTSGISSVTQDGFGAGGLSSLSVNAQGILSATFDNGQSRPLYQLAIAQFNAPEGLASEGNQTYHATVDSGPPAIATAGSQGTGTIVSGALEQSNVQIAQEFINLISAQRSFEANARVVSGSDQMLQDLVNIVH
ncbi:MAG TPA: flagellar hook protein FlgE [Candidatus Binatia bacterium]|nr:flagellar hook protein FlgE [Candidatus Binatia bacterium]